MYIRKEKKNLELIGTVFQVKILINLQSFLNYLRMLIYPKLLLYIIFKWCKMMQWYTVTIKQPQYVKIFNN